MFDFTDERDWLKVFGTDLDLSHFISEPIKEVKVVTNAQHLIENAICCLERGETIETFMSREANVEANIARDAVYSAETVLEMIWEAAQYAYHDYRLWIRNELEREKEE